MTLASWLRGRYLFTTIFGVGDTVSEGERAAEILAAGESEAVCIVQQV